MVVLSDYDGTLAPIVSRPEDALPAPGAVDALVALVTRLGRVGIVSGRPVTFLRDRIGVDGIVLRGHYGLERLDGALDGAVTRHPEVGRHAQALAQARSEIERTWPDLDVQHEGDVSFTVHWRRFPERAVPDEIGVLAQRHGLVTQMGRMAVEVRPPIAADKGDAVAELVAGFEGALFVGDDRGDLPGFAALEAVPVALAVGVASAEAPAELPGAVDVMVDGPKAVVALLDAVAARFGET